MEPVLQPFLQKENMLLQLRVQLAASFNTPPATEKSQCLQKHHYPDITSCAPHHCRASLRRLRDRDGRHSDQSATVYKSRYGSSESLTTRSCPAWNCWDWKKNKRELQCL